MEEEAIVEEPMIKEADYSALHQEHEALKAAHAALQKEHDDLKVQFGLAKKAYTWKPGDSECAPVHSDAECPRCHWTAKTREPHPILA